MTRTYTAAAAPVYATPSTDASRGVTETDAVTSSARTVIPSHSVAKDFE
ncbi:MAG: hypothetical protein ABWX76_01380 [Leifsonia flava]